MFGKHVGSAIKKRAPARRFLATEALEASGYEMRRYKPVITANT